ncbi:hypothetical protein F5Y03DRAFT_403314 [Xylaria venustula]|nr:hypothetical protein F5Y03DRAFT_403314 [Xylaria venustula]
MDSLEAFEYGRSISGQLPHLHLIPPIVLPLKINESNILHQRDLFKSTVLFLDDDIVVKMYNQFRVVDVELPSSRLYLELCRGGFIAQEVEQDLFKRIKHDGCSHLVHKIDVEEPTCAFFERLQPVSSLWDDASLPRRRRWAVELTSAFAAIEELGRIPEDIHVRDLGIDRTGRLRLVGFGASPSPPSSEEIERFEADGFRFHPADIFGKHMQTAHQRLASCLHYLLSGVDPDKEASGFTNLQDLTRFREKVRSGGYAVQPDASPITDILQAAWMLKTGTETFASIAEKVSSALNQLEIESNEALPPHISDQHYLNLGNRCLEWLSTQEKNPEWMERSKYKSACEDAGFFWGDD